MIVRPENNPLDYVTTQGFIWIRNAIVERDRPEWITQIKRRQQFNESYLLLQING